MTQLGLPLSGARLRDDGISHVELNQEAFVRVARSTAQRISDERGEVHIDDVREALASVGAQAPHRNCWGAIFRPTREGRWVRVGIRASRVPGNHAHASPVWRWVAAVK